MLFVPTARPIDRALQARRAFFGPLTRLLNPAIRRLAGRAGVPLLGLVYHHGRRSGRTYATPVGAGSTGAALLIPLTFGSGSDWCRNVLAEGGCTIVWRGVLHTARHAEVVDDVAARADVNAAFDPLQRLAFRLMGTHQFLRLGRVDPPPARRAPAPSGTARARARLRGIALYALRRGVNPLVLALARRQPVARLAILEHRGRRSGRLYRTPVEARRAPGGGFVIPLTWGERTDWFQNIRAAGGCTLHWRGSEYALAEPEIVDRADARATFHPLERLVLRLGGVRLVHLHQVAEPPGTG